MKKRLTQTEEFEVMKLVIDKFLSIGSGIMVLGLYTTLKGQTTMGVTWMIMGAVILIVLMVLIVKEFEVIR